MIIAVNFPQGSYPFSATSFQDFSRTFPELRLIFQGSKIHINPYTHKISMLILLTVFLTLHIFLLSLTDFQNFPGPVPFFQDFPVLENAIIKFQDFPGFPGPVRTLFPTLLGAICCVRLTTVLRLVGCCWLKFDHFQT